MLADTPNEKQIAAILMDHQGCESTLTEEAVAFSCGIEVPAPEFSFAQAQSLHSAKAIVRGH